MELSDQIIYICDFLGGANCTADIAGCVCSHSGAVRSVVDDLLFFGCTEFVGDDMEGHTCVFAQLSKKSLICSSCWISTDSPDSSVL